MRSSRPLPPKTKLISTITKPNDAPLTPEDARKSNAHRNEFVPVKFHRAPWLLALFGDKDGISSLRHFGLKAEISAFTSEVFRLFTNGHSPKYRAVTYQEETAFAHRSIAFITKQLDEPITLSSLMIALRDMNSGRFVDVYPIHAHDMLDYASTMSGINRWYGQVLSMANQIFIPLLKINRPELEIKDVQEQLKSLLDKLKQDVIDGYKRGLQAYNNVNMSSGNNSLERTARWVGADVAYQQKLVNCLTNDYRQNIINFINEKLVPLFRRITGILSTCLLENGFPEMMAVSFLLNDRYFKTVDVVLNNTLTNVYKLDHERAFNRLSEVAVETLAGGSPKPVRIVSTSELQDFPFNLKEWLLGAQIADYASWFGALLKNKNFLHKAYFTMLAYVLMPNDSLKALVRQFFHADYVDQMIEHIVLQKEAIRLALKNTKQFLAYLAADEEIPAQLQTLFAAHNQRWHKEKYAEIRVDIATILQSYRDMQAKWRSREKKVNERIHLLFSTSVPVIDLSIDKTGDANEPPFVKCVLQ